MHSQLTQSPFTGTDCLFFRLWDGLKQYGEFVRTKLQGLEGLLLDDPRSLKEKAMARKLQELALQRQATLPVEAMQPAPGIIKFFT